MLTTRWLIFSASQTFRLSSMSFGSPAGIMTPETFSGPRARAHRAAVTVESFPPEMPITTFEKP